MLFADPVDYQVSKNHIFSSVPVDSGFDGMDSVVPKEVTGVPLCGAAVVMSILYSQDLEYRGRKTREESNSEAADIQDNQEKCKKCIDTALSRSAGPGPTKKKKGLEGTKKKIEKRGRESRAPTTWASDTYHTPPPDQSLFSLHPVPHQHHVSQLAISLWAH